MCAKHASSRLRADAKPFASSAATSVSQSSRNLASAPDSRSASPSQKPMKSSPAIAPGMLSASASFQNRPTTSLTRSYLVG